MSTPPTPRRGMVDFTFFYYAFEMCMRQCEIDLSANVSVCNICYWCRRDGTTGAAGRHVDKGRAQKVAAAESDRGSERVAGKNPSWFDSTTRTERLFSFYRICIVVCVYICMTCAACSYRWHWCGVFACCEVLSLLIVLTELCQVTCCCVSSPHGESNACAWHWSRTRSNQSRGSRPRSDG